jgi:hypothetical protein
MVAASMPFASPIVARMLFMVASSMPFDPVSVANVRCDSSQ